jgi:hypothetical protein
MDRDDLHTRVTTIRKPLDLLRSILTNLKTQVDARITADDGGENHLWLTMFFGLVLGAKSLSDDIDDALYGFTAFIDDLQGQIAGYAADNRYLNTEMQRLRQENLLLRNRLYAFETLPRYTRDMPDAVKFLAFGLGSHFDPDARSFRLMSIKKCREMMGVGLVDAKNAVEAFIISHEAKEYEQRIRRWVDDFVKNNPDERPKFFDLAQKWQDFCDASKASEAAA